MIKKNSLHIILVVTLLLVIGVDRQQSAAAPLDTSIMNTITMESTMADFVGEIIGDSAVIQRERGEAILPSSVKANFSDFSAPSFWSVRSLSEDTSDSLISLSLIPNQSPIEYNSVFTITTTDDTQDINPGDAICADNFGSCSLRAAIEETNLLTGTNTIFVSKGEYVLSLGELHIFNSVNIKGADKDGTVVSGDNADRIFLIDNLAGSSQIQISISGITIQDGYKPEYGGAVWNDEILIMIDTAVKHSTSENRGGGIYNINGSVSLVKSEIILNSVPEADRMGGGGGIFNDNGSVMLINTKVISNSVIGKNFLGGGGIFNSYGTMTIMDGIVDQNTISVRRRGVAADGGGIFSDRGELFLYNTTISNNSVFDVEDGMGSRGGGISIHYADVEINSSTIRDNNSANGGGIENIHSNLYICDSLIISNTADAGGGIHNATIGKLTIERSSISNNSSKVGGGIYQYAASSNILECTISGNTAGDHGSAFVNKDNSSIEVTNSTLNGNGIYNQGDMKISHSTISDTLATEAIHVVSGSVRLWNTILSGACSGDLRSNGYNLISDAYKCQIPHPASDIVGQNPRLGPLGNYGGNTNTHPLLADSPAIDAGSCSTYGGNMILTDQRGAARRGQCDIGAYEYRGTFIIYIPVVNSTFP